MFVLQVFGDMNMAGLDKDLQSALSQGTTDLEKMGSQTSLNKVHTKYSIFPFLVHLLHSVKAFIVIFTLNEASVWKIYQIPSCLMYTI